MKATIITKRFIKCPKCDNTFGIEHLMGKECNNRPFGPWQCDDCTTTIKGRVVDGQVEIEEVEPRGYPTLSLVKFKDTYLVLEHKIMGNKNGKIENWDFFFHSHQCPANLLRSVISVFDYEESDPHGMIRFISSIPFNIENKEKLDRAYLTEHLFDLFNTIDGEPQPSEWPEENKGMLDWIAQMKGDNQEH
jgi:hypothetical protein